jgi:hypothetical protein
LIDRVRALAATLNDLALSLQYPIHRADRTEVGMYGRLLFARCFSGLACGYLHVCIRPFGEALPLALMESADRVPSTFRLSKAST